MNILNRKRLKIIRKQLKKREVQLEFQATREISSISFNVMNALEEEIQGLKNERNHIMRFGRGEL